MSRITKMTRAEIDAALGGDPRPFPGARLTREQQQTAEEWRKARQEAERNNPNRAQPVQTADHRLPGGDETEQGRAIAELEESFQEDPSPMQEKAQVLEQTCWPPHVFPYDSYKLAYSQH